MSHTRRQFFLGLCLPRLRFRHDPSRCAAVATAAQSGITKRCTGECWSCGSLTFFDSSSLIAIPTLTIWSAFPVTVNVPRLECARSGQSVNEPSAPVPRQFVDTDTTETPRSYFRTLIGVVILCALLAVVGCATTYDYIREPLGNSSRYQLMVLPILAATLSLPFSLIGVLCLWRCRRKLNNTVIVGIVLSLITPWIPIVAVVIHDGL